MIDFIWKLNLLVIVTPVLFWLGKSSLRFFSVPLRFQTELKLHHLTLVLIIAFAMAAPLLPKSTVFEPPVKIWSESSARAQIDNQFVKEIPQATFIMNSGDLLTIQWRWIQSISLILFFLSFIWQLSTLLRGHLQLAKIIGQSSVLRQLGRVDLVLNDVIPVPFSYWNPLSGRAAVVMPSSLLAQNKNFQIAIAHELQHLRQRDTHFVYVLLLLKMFCFLNPFYYLWHKHILQIQEFACDEILLGRNKVESQEYARCLIEVAEHALRPNVVSVCATGMAFMNGAKTIQRRIHYMKHLIQAQYQKLLFRLGAGMLTLILGVVSYASADLLEDRRVTMAEAQKMVLAAKQKSDFPVVVNEQVLKWLNHYIGKPDGRQFMRSALGRMAKHQGMITEKLQGYSLPMELLAVPLIESGYLNLPQGKNGNWPSWHAAGIWQFIQQTARNYGLRVDKDVDERLNIEKATDAALRYLQSNYARFQDWQLALMAYNMGENAVQSGIDETGSRDAWELIRRGHQGDKGYLAKAMAAVLIYYNPEAVE